MGDMDTLADAETLAKSAAISPPPGSPMSQLVLTELQDVSVWLRRDVRGARPPPLPRKWPSRVAPCFAVVRPSRLSPQSPELVRFPELAGRCVEIVDMEEEAIAGGASASAVPIRRCRCIIDIRPGECWLHATDLTEA